MKDAELVLRYAPEIYSDEHETIPIRAVGYSIVRENCVSESFPKRNILTGGQTAFVIEYAYYWDYDIQHMYDLEHIWVHVGQDGTVLGADGSFHGGFTPLKWQGVSQFTDDHIHAYCQPGKHAFVADAVMAKAVPGARDACTGKAGGPVLVGGPFAGAYHPTEEDDRLSEWYIRKYLSFEPTFRFSKTTLETAQYMPWETLKARIPGWIATECERIRTLAGQETGECR